ncbi:hypothetical protein [Actinomadura sp. 9N215]|uniref:hypothetical protein n=1 Tax=Actinomadura sp. 9N215 TaxID=3375150 RepID=UPI0037AFAAE9
MSAPNELFRTPALTFAGDRSFLDSRSGALLARTVQRNQSRRRMLSAGDVMDVRDPYGTVLLAIGRIRPGYRVSKRAQVWWPDGRRAGGIRPEGFVHCDFLLRDPDDAVLGVAERASRGFRENYRVNDVHGVRVATVVEPLESVRSMGEKGALPSSRWLNVEFQSDVTASLHALVLALPLTIRMRRSW